MTLDDLERLEASATKLPWRVKWETEYGDFGSVIQGELRGIEGVEKHTPDGRWEFVRWIARFDDDYGHDVGPDAALIVALRNAAPALIEIARRARVTSDNAKQGWVEHWDALTPEVFELLALDELGRALDALEQVRNS